MIYNADLDKSFDTKEELIDALVATKRINIAKRKSAIKEKRCSFAIVSDSSDTTTKAISLGVGSTIYPVINTTNFLDSHDDVHGKSIWNKSAKEQSGKTFFITDHNLNFENIISWPQDVEIMLQEMTWKELGQDLPGSTVALIFKTEIKDYANKAYLSALKSGMPIEHSIRMRYIDVELAVDNPKYEEEHKVWKETIDLVANRELAEERGYYYYVKEAAISQEGSAVLFGSNSATPTLTEIPTKQNIEPSSDTQKQESSYYFLLQKHKH